jgi:hypothetical protein
MRIKTLQKGNETMSNGTFLFTAEHPILCLGLAIFLVSLHKREEV